jgi:hypothetical protein
MSKKADQKYKGNGNHEWEFAALNTYRLRVPGGWLYRYELPAQYAMSYCQPSWSGVNPGPAHAERQSDGMCAMQFVPMPEVVKHKV